MRALFFALLLPLAACGSDTPDATAPPEAAGDAEVGFGDPIRGEVAALETSSEGEIEVGITDEVLFFRLSEASRAEIQKELDAERSEGGIGGAITEMIGGVVNKALATTAQIPLAEIQDVRYENGTLVVESSREGATFDLGNEDPDGGLTFDAHAAQRIIIAFEAAR